VQAAFEHIDASPQSSWKYHLRREPDFPFGWHFHDECELTLITEGRGSRFVGDSIEAYEAGDLVLLGPELPHTYTADRRPGGENNEAIAAQFRVDFLGPHTFGGPDFESVGRLVARARRGLAFPAVPAADVATTMQRMETMDGPRRTLALLDVLLTLAETPGGRPLASDRYWPSIDAAGRASIDTICAFLADAYPRSVTLAETAAVAHMAPTTFSRFFRRAMGRSVTAYVIELRVAAACRLLIDTDFSVAVVAARCGYGNLSNFNRQFHRLKQTTPLAYRKAFERGRPTLPQRASRARRYDATSAPTSSTEAPSMMARISTEAMTTPSAPAAAVTA
jgi:AraC-like DNA-binding protein